MKIEIVLWGSYVCYFAIPGMYDVEKSHFHHMCYFLVLCEMYACSYVPPVLVAKVNVLFVSAITVLY